jgi:hypothetical protein
LGQRVAVASRGLRAMHGARRPLKDDLVGIQPNSVINYMHERERGAHLWVWTVGQSSGGMNMLSCQKHHREPDFDFLIDLSSNRISGLQCRTEQRRFAGNRYSRMNAMRLFLVSVNVNRHAHPNTVFAVLQNEAGESVSVQIRFDPSTNVDNLTLREITARAREEMRRLEVG